MERHESPPKRSRAHQKYMKTEVQWIKFLEPSLSYQEAIDMAEKHWLTSSLNPKAQKVIEPPYCSGDLE